MKSLLVLICVFAFSLALEYNFEVPPLRLSSLIKLEKRHSPSSQHQQHGRSAEQGKDVDNVQAYQDERKLPKDNLDDMAPAWSTQGNSQTCYYDMNATVIIKTNRSLTAGAKFVKFVQAENSLECARQCCDTPACNQAIFENKDDYSCYLFDCGEPSVCVFAWHKSYISMNFAQKMHHNYEEQPHQASKHENELAGLDKQKPLNHATSSPTTTTTTTAATTTTTTTTTTLSPTTVSTTIASTTTKRKPKIVSLNDECTLNDKCEDRHAECVQEKCTCQSGYYIKYGICRRQCDKHHFECDKKNSLKEGLDCIELQHVCDGIPQCPDSSDEEGCSPDAFEDGPDSDVPYQVAASPSRDSIEEEMPNIGTKLKPSMPPHHAESSNQKLKQRGDLAKAKYNAKSSIEKDNLDLPSQDLEKTKNLAQADPLATKKSQNQQYPIQIPDIRNKEAWVKKTRVQKLFHHNGAIDGTPNNPVGKNDVDVQPSSRETSRIAEQPDRAGPVWHHLGSYPKYQKQGVVSGQGNRDVMRSRLQQQQQQQRQHEEQLLQQQQQQQQRQQQSQQQLPLNEGSVSNYGETDHQQVPLMSPQDTLTQRKIYGEDGQPLIAKNYILNGQSQNQQLQGHVYQPSSQNYISNQYLQENAHMPLKQQQQPPPRKYGYHGNNYGYRQKVAAYHNGYPLQQQQQPYQQVSGTYRDPSNGYASNSGQAYNWGDYPADYLYTDQNPDYSNIGANAVQGYQYQPANVRNRPLSHNLGKGSSTSFGQHGHHQEKKLPACTHLSDDHLSDGTPKLRPSKTHGHYQATGNGPKGASHQLLTGTNPKVYGSQSPTQKAGIHKQPSTGLHTESKMHTADDQESQLANTENTKAKQEHKENSAGSEDQNGTAVTIDGHRGSTAAPTATGTISSLQNMTSPQTETGLAKFLQQSNYILKEKVVVASPTDNAQGPIVALALGLSFTTMLLIFVGCRLRRVKRRLRKGRALHSNEADYLINGMYL